MTQQEFEARAMRVSIEEFETINAMYMASDVDKDEFCKLWVKMNNRRVKAFQAEQKRIAEEMELKDKVAAIYWNMNEGENGWICLAVNVYSDKEKEALSKAGIEMEEEQRVYQVRYEMAKYLKIA